ncbi:MAG TPA: signal peptidase I, partial [Terrimesophilobacter sp.]|nr:signal peptidase I [Terrimesophilobacter sp.]
MSGRRIREKEHGVLYYIGVGLSFGLLGLVMLLGAAAIVVPAVTGSTPMTVLTRSMEPTYPPGTLVIVKPVQTEDIRIGDAITYQIASGQPEVVTHRVVSIISSSDGERRFITQGDNNAVPDAVAVRGVQIRGAVWYAIPWIGYVNNLVTAEVRAWAVPVFAIALFLYAGFQLAHWLITRRRPND